MAGFPGEGLLYSSTPPHALESRRVCVPLSCAVFLPCKDCVAAGEVMRLMGSGSSSLRSSYHIENRIPHEVLCGVVKSHCDSFPVQFCAKKMQVLNEEF